MAYVRVSPGVWKDQATGKTIQSKDDPNKKAPAKDGGGKKGGGKQPVQQGVAGLKSKDYTNPSKIAPAQKYENEQTAKANVGLNRVDQTTSFGSRVYNPDGSVTDSLDPGQQQLLDQQVGTGTIGSRVAGQLLGGIQGPYDAQGALGQYLPQGSDEARQKTYDATYGQITRDVAANKQRDQAALSQSLADRGIPVGSELYNDQMKQFNTRYDNIENDARQQATLAGNSAFQQSFDQGATSYGLRKGAYDSNFAMPAQLAGQLNSMQQIQRPDLIGFTPIEQQGVDLQGMYDTATGAGLKNRELNIAQSQAGGGGRSSGGGGGGEFIPGVGGVVGGPQGQPQQRQPSFGQSIANGAVQGVIAGQIGQIQGRKAQRPTSQMTAVNDVGEPQPSIGAGGGFGQGIAQGVAQGVAKGFTPQQKPAPKAKVQQKPPPKPQLRRVSPGVYR